MYQGRVCLSEVWSDRITFDDHNTRVRAQKSSLPFGWWCEHHSSIRESRERRPTTTIPLRHELARTHTHTNMHTTTVLSCTIFYRLLFVLWLGVSPSSISPCFHKSSPRSYWNQTADSREHFISCYVTRFVNGYGRSCAGRLACQPKLWRLPALAFRGAINVEGAGLSMPRQ